MDNKYKKGDIYYCDFGFCGGSLQQGIRPALIVQNNIGNEYSTTLLVSPITSVCKKDKQPTHVILDSSCGLISTSMVLLEQIHTVDKASQIRGYIGSVILDGQLKQINKALRSSLDLNC